MSETPIEIKKILEAKAHDIPMSADDILFVPSSTRKIIGKRTLDSAIQMATAVTVVGCASLNFLQNIQVSLRCLLARKVLQDILSAVVPQ